MNSSGRSVDAEPKEKLFAQIALMGGALAAPARLRIFALLCHREHTVAELAEKTDQTLATASAHLKTLRESGLVSTTKTGRHVHCRPASPAAVKLWLALRDAAVENLPLARELHLGHYGAQSSRSPLTPRQFEAVMRRSTVALFDLRPADEYAVAHIPGAINLPLAELAKTKTPPEIFPGADCFVYCRGPHCDGAVAGIKRLRDLRVPASRLGFSIPEWENAGLRTEPARRRDA